MRATVTKRCATCGLPFLWTPAEQDVYHANGLTPPRQCPQHRGELQRREDTTNALTPARASAAMAVPELQQLLVADDVRQLLVESSMRIVDRRRTLGEWYRGADLRQEQIDKKIAAGQAAKTLIGQRVDIMKSASEMVQVAANLRRQKLEAQRDELKLEREIAALSGEAEAPRSERERVLEEHRENRQARLRASDEMLQDFLGEVRQVCDSRASIHERALRLQNLLTVFEMPEDALPADAVWILKASERIRDAS